MGGDRYINIADFDYGLPEERIAKFPLAKRDASRLLVWRSGNDTEGDAGGDTGKGDTGGDAGGDAGRCNISETTFGNIGSVIPAGSLLVFNNTRVVRARLVMHKPATAGTSEQTGATGAAGTSEQTGTGEQTGTTGKAEQARANGKAEQAGTTEATEVADGRATGGGARIEILCLEPASPSGYERSFAARGSCEWRCMVGNLKKWKSGPLETAYKYGGSEHILRARCIEKIGGGEQTVRFEWDTDINFGQLLELSGRVPVPPYLGRDDEAIDSTRYQTVYGRIDGSVAAPTAGLHFTPEMIARLEGKNIGVEEVTLHVGAGTFLPVKVDNALEHSMHTEHFEVSLAAIEHLSAKAGNIIAVGTTSVRTLESLPALARRIATSGDPDVGRPVGQFEPHDIPGDFDGVQALEILATWMRAHSIDRLQASTRIMITPAGFDFRLVSGIVTNFHQPKSTLLLLVAAFTGGDNWRRIYDHALGNGFRFLSYGDGSLLLKS